MSKVNTERPAGKDIQKKEAVLTPKKNKEAHEKNSPVKKEESKAEKAEEKGKTEAKKHEAKKTKKTRVTVAANNLQVSTKKSIDICRFIMKKRIDEAIKELEEVVKLKKAIPMKGEYPHRKGKIMSGRFPSKTAKEFIILLKSLKGNANNHDLEDPVITEAVSNKGAKAYASGGRTKKRTHILIAAASAKIHGGKK